MFELGNFADFDDSNFLIGLNLFCFEDIQLMAGSCGGCQSTTDSHELLPRNRPTPTIER